jgi:membrane protein implicated in regulation of membrane protease activity
MQSKVKSAIAPFKKRSDAPHRSQELGRLRVDGSVWRIELEGEGVITKKMWAYILAPAFAGNALYGLVSGSVYFPGGRAGSGEGVWVHFTEWPIGYSIVVIGSLAFAWLFWKIGAEDSEDDDEK